MRLLSFIVSCLLLTSNLVLGVSETFYFNNYYEKEDGKAVTVKFYPISSGLTFRKDGKLYFVHQDHLGSNNVITDLNGNKIGEIRYYPYGSTLNLEGNIPTERRYTGQIEDDSTDLYYYIARYYNRKFYFC